MAALGLKTTHAAREAVDACRLMTILMRRALAGESKDDVLDEDAWGQSLRALRAAICTKNSRHRDGKL